MAQRGRGLAHSAQTNPAQPFKPQAQDRGASLHRKGTSATRHPFAAPPPNRVPWSPVSTSTKPMAAFEGGGCWKRKGPAKSMWRKGLNSPCLTEEETSLSLQVGWGAPGGSSYCCRRRASPGARHHPPLLLPASPGSGQTGTPSCWISQRKA